MLSHTRGIVFHTTRFSESSIVAKIYTEESGLMAFLVNGVYGRKNPKSALLQPLSLVDMVIYKNERKQLQRVKEVRCDYPYTGLVNEANKRSIALFLNEVLYKSIREEEPNPALFGFIYHWMQLLDLNTGNYLNMHLLFLVQLSRFLGFYPHSGFSEKNPYFDLMEGTFKPQEPNHPFFAPPETSRLISQLMNQNTESIEIFTLTGAERKNLLAKLIAYYELHVPGMKEIRSHKVLEEVLG